ncbi:hypothetical protein B0J13DRAFT_328956 [Dactylonectria estremocensis]|uniref:BZIP domain-containing protein n=1 Tax=Dactylonectria estremocensis TaxID=1079267 RepID=A0A9P9EV56_9HYPO|nr:hypothetical protein B0J13DRAFT_328956 [Dactylonectria estremocensis]
MSTPTKDTKNLERVRDNQRRSRARRREHLAELEHRIRTYELQGIEASSEVQLAARRVAEENRVLRGIIAGQGISNEYVASVLQATALAHPDPGSISHFASNSPSEAVQALQQTMLPRRPIVHDQPVSYPIPPQENRDRPMTNAPTTSNPVWEPAQPIQPGISFPRPLPSNAPPPMGRPSIPTQLHHQQYTPPAFPGPQIPRTEGFLPSPAPMLDDPRRQSYSVPSLQGDGSSAMNYSLSMHAFQTQGGSNPPGPDPGSC